MRLNSIKARPGHAQPPATRVGRASPAGGARTAGSGHKGRGHAPAAITDRLRGAVRCRCTGAFPNAVYKSCSGRFVVTSCASATCRACPPRRSIWRVLRQAGAGPVGPRRLIVRTAISAPAHVQGRGRRDGPALAPREKPPA